jgi:hypothetical protein
MAGHCGLETANRATEVTSRAARPAACPAAMGRCIRYRVIFIIALLLLFFCSRQIIDYTHNFHYLKQLATKEAGLNTEAPLVPTNAPVSPRMPTVIMK